MLVLGLVLGTGTAWLAIRLVHARLDPAPQSPPAPLLRLDVASPVAALGVALLTGLFVAVALDVRRRRASLDGVLRRAG